MKSNHMVSGQRYDIIKAVGNNGVAEIVGFDLTMRLRDAGYFASNREDPDPRKFGESQACLQIRHLPLSTKLPVNLHIETVRSRNMW